MHCRYCHRPRSFDHHACLRCRLLIANGDWDQLATLQLFFHSQDWTNDVAAFIEMTETAVAEPRVPVGSTSVTLTASDLELVHSVLDDAGDDSAEFCRDCDARSRRL